MKCIIVDDEPLAREGIELNMEDVKFLELVGQFSNAIAANSFLLNQEVDLIFLDIQMPGLTGLEFLRSLKHKPLVILTTAYPEFALEGFELDVVDYLLKPIRLSRFIKAVNKAKDLYELKKNGGRLVKGKSDEFIYIKSERKYVRVFFNDILYIKGMKDYVMIYTPKEHHMTAMNIKTIYDQLPPSIFFRISKSYIININFIESVSHEAVIIKGLEIPIGKTYRDEFIRLHIKDKLIERK